MNATARGALLVFWLQIIVPIATGDDPITAAGIEIQTEPHPECLIKDRFVPYKAIIKQSAFYQAQMATGGQIIQLPSSLNDNGPIECKHKFLRFAVGRSDNPSVKRISASKIQIYYWGKAICGKDGYNAISQFNEQCGSSAVISDSKLKLTQDIYITKLATLIDSLIDDMHREKGSLKLDKGALSDIGGLTRNSQRTFGISDLPMYATEGNDPESKGGQSERARKNVEDNGVEDNISLRLIAVFLGPLLGMIFLFLIGAIPTETKGEQRKREKYYRAKNNVPPSSPRSD